MLIKLDYLIYKYGLKINGISHFGAHLGQEVSNYKELGIKNIHLFEPQKSIFKELEKKFMNDPDVSLYNFGLGSEDKSVKINLSPNNEGMSASILDPEKHKKFYPDIEFIGTEEIDIKIYDKLIIDKVNFLNIDVQGYELHALKGSILALQKFIDYIFIEVNREELYEGSVLVDDLDIFLERYNFIRVETKWVNRFIPWGDAIYIKKEFASNLRIIISNLQKYLERFNYYYFLIDTNRAFQRLKYRSKKRIKNLLNHI